MKTGVVMIGLLCLTLPGMALGGMITGEVKLTGDIPSPKMLEVKKDQDVCGKGPIPSDELVVSKATRGVQNAVVSIKDIKTDKKAQAPGKIALTQKKCIFSPHVLMIPANTEFEILNNDPLTHNIHTFGIENATINRGQPKTVPVIKHKFEFPERIKVQCDIHSWMKAWFIVVDNPYTAVSGTDGNFKIADVPPGTYKLTVWHEALGTQTKDVTVKGDEEVKVVFELAAKK
jgi:plastocyanin